MRLNNKGYMLVEIILASVLAMMMAYFLTNLTIKLKNKNDDLLVRTLVSTDQAIMYNTLMKEIYNGTFDCDNVKINNRVFTYKYADGSSFKNIINEYAKLSNMVCSDSNKVNINIPMSIAQLEEDFSIKINTVMEKKEDPEPAPSGGTGGGTNEILVQMFKKNGVSQICYKATCSHYSSDYKCSTSTIVTMTFTRDHDVSAYVYGIPEDGYVMDSCSESSPCNFYDQYLHPEGTNYIVHMYHPTLTATLK